MRCALITGINGQDGSYLAEFLLAKGYHVVGTTPDRNLDQERISHVRDRIRLVETDLLSQSELEAIISEHRPDEIYNLAARASSSDLWTDPVLTGDLNGLTVTRLLAAIQNVNSRIRFVQASSSEIFGNTEQVPQNESTPLRPRNAYGIAKAYGHWAAGLYRDYQGIFACSAILYNHESPRRGLEFVTRKIAHAAAKIKHGDEHQLRLGSLEACRDWGFAGDYVRAMWLMLQQPTADDYVIATGEVHSVLEFCQLAFAYVGLDYRDFVVVDTANSRPPEPTQLVGNPARANRVLGWKPSLTFPDLVRMMVDADFASSRRRSDVATNRARGAANTNPSS
jgi:GDPmannose 4,6-dehydratase